MFMESSFVRIYAKSREQTDNKIKCIIHEISCIVLLQPPIKWPNMLKRWRSGTCY